MADLGALPGAEHSQAEDINDAGQVVGISRTPTGNRAFLWQNGVMTDLGTLPGANESYALGINNDGQVVGFSDGRPFLWQDGVMTELGGLPGADYNWPSKINGLGQVVGRSHVAENVRATRWSIAYAPPPPAYKALVEGHCDGRANPKITCDPNTGLEWLDLTETLGLTFDAMNTGLASTFGGYRYASNAEVVELFTHGGVIPPNDSNVRDANLAPVTRMIELVGTTSTCCGYVIAAGMTGDASGGDTRSLGVLQRTATAGMSYVSNTGPSETSNGHWLVAKPSPNTTPVGSNVQVQPNDQTTGEPSPISLTFSNVTGSGTTTVTSGSIGNGSGPPPPSGFRLGNPKNYFDISTTATFSGPVTICISYAGTTFGNESQLKLLHGDGSGNWTDVTTLRDTQNKIICGSVTSFSPFLVAEDPYIFTGFFKPLENKDAGGRYILNQVKAGAAVPVKFSLSGNHGLDIFASGFPISATIPCDLSASVDNVQETLTAGSSSLSYDAATGQYAYVWKTDKAWSGCRQLTVRLKTGQEHKVSFKFTR
jgi:probable HAF family extracellular repeat protein